MTFQELLTAAGEKGFLPCVRWEGREGKARIGVVTVIKSNDKYKGCAVDFGDKFEQWFWDSSETDARTKYMRDLTLDL